jgi:hypothetical protein
MEKAYKFKRDSRQYQVLIEHHEKLNKWCDPEVLEKVSEFLGCKTGLSEEHGIYSDSYQLTMRNPPKHLMTNFKKDGEHCKIATKINRDWQKLCETLGLKTVRQHDLAWELGWIFGDKACKIHHIGDDYYVEPNGGTFDKDDFLEPIDMPTFLRIRADWEEKRN